ncbi:MAG: phage tail sheath subtilisin-like domain-containing protein [Chloroflexi bacterium]|nr:phage tail sheath subtilisin-like domain-containing protein [Chloroflexota bacterium]
MLATPGVYFEYAHRPPAVAGLRTDVAAFIGYAERGPLLVPLRLTNWRQFVTAFGEPLPYAYLGEAVRGFFSNGGAVCYIVRVADVQIAREASLNLFGGDGNPSLAILASHGLVPDPETGEPLRDDQSQSPRRYPSQGVWGNRISISLLPATPGATNTTLPQPNTGEVSYLETLSGFGKHTMVRLVQDGTEAPEYRRITAVTAHLMQVEWDKPITGLGLDLQRPIQVEIVAFTLRIAFDGQIVETHSDLTVSPEHSQYVITRLWEDSTLIDAQLAPAWGTDTSAVQVMLRDPNRWMIPVDNLPLSGGLDGIATVGADDFLDAVAALADISEVSLLAAPDIVLRAEPEPNPLLLLRPVDCTVLDPLPPGKIEGTVVDPTGAPVRGVRVQPIGVNIAAVNTPANGSFALQNLPLSQIILRFERDGYESLEATAQARQTPIEPLSITLNPVATPPALAVDDIADIQSAMIQQGENGGYRVVLLDPPETHLSMDAIQTWRQRFDTSYAALYYPWVIVSTDDGFRAVPPSGHVAGVIARTDLTIGPHRAPANYVLNGVQALSTPVGTAEQGVLNPLGINCLRALPGQGLRVYGARTVSSASEWRYLNVRRLILMLEKALESSTQWAVFEPNNLLTRQILRFSISQFLDNLWRRGALAGNDPVGAYTVRCDETNNPPEVIDAGQLIVEIAVAPAIPFEFIRFRLGRTVEAITVTE